MRPPQLLAVGGLAAVLVAPSPTRGDELFAVYRPAIVDTTTGLGRSVGPGVWDQLNSLARDPSGDLYSVGAGRLLRVDPYTVTLTPVLDIIDLGTATGLAFSPMGELFATRRGSSINDPLLRIDLTTGQATAVGDTGIYALQALEFSPDGTLYGWSILRGLVRIDPRTGRGTDVNPDVGATADIQALAFDTAGRLYGARDALFEINLETGIPVQIGPGGLGDVRGLALIPEPSARRLFSVATLLVFTGGTWRYRSSRRF